MAKDVNSVRILLEQNPQTSQIHQLRTIAPHLTLEQCKQIIATVGNKGVSKPQVNSTGLSFPTCLLSQSQSNLSHAWVIDSGATDHITNSCKLLTNISSPSMPPVGLPTGAKAPIQSTGTITFDSHLHLTDVLCVPSFNVNLMSVSKLTNALNCCVVFFPQHCIMQDLDTKRTIGLGRRHGDLYYFHPPPSPTSHHVSTPPNLWHMRLGHPSDARLRLLATKNFDISFSNKPCDFCPLAKQTRLPFTLSSITSTAPFDLIHCDIWGPHKVSSHSGAKYFLTIVDDFTRCTWVYLMHYKSDT